MCTAEYTLVSGHLSVIFVGRDLHVATHLQYIDVHIRVRSPTAVISATSNLHKETTSESMPEFTQVKGHTTVKCAPNSFLAVMHSNVTNIRTL